MSEYKRKPGVKPRKVILYEGDPRVIRIIPMNPFHLVCCDCGMVHRYKFSVVKDGIHKGRPAFVCSPAKRRTAAQRKKHRHPFVARHV